MTTTTQSYWQVGTGAPSSGGSYGITTDTFADDGDFLYTSTMRPVGAVDISEAEFDVLDAAFAAAWMADATGGEAYVSSIVVEVDALRASAMTKLQNAQPLTAEESAVIAGVSP